ncbi:MAG: hypothetical protein KKD89_07035 [Candidatus Omnitrophica bacterium]|nr:hypothetical protein [Candidatus Omnitrophota bacterium]
MSITRSASFRTEESKMNLPAGHKPIVKSRLTLDSGVIDLSDRLLSGGTISQQVNEFEGLINVSDTTIQLRNDDNYFSENGKIGSETPFHREVELGFVFEAIPQGDEIRLFQGTVEFADDSGQHTMSYKVRDLAKEMLDKDIGPYPGELVPLIYTAINPVDMLEDIIVNQMGFDPSVIDTVSFVESKAFLPMEFSGFITKRENGIKFIEQEILQVVGGRFYINEENKIVYKHVQPHFVDIDYVIADTTNMLDRNAKTNINKMRNRYELSYGISKSWTVSDGAIQYHQTDKFWSKNEDESITEYGLTKPHKVTSKFIDENTTAFEAMATRFFMRFSEPLLVSTYESKLDLIACQIGDIVRSIVKI